jgi:ribonuclease E
VGQLGRREDRRRAGAIAAEPQPVRVPRERPAPVSLDEGPLVLVETRRDLGEMRLPL